MRHGVSLELRQELEFGVVSRWGRGVLERNGQTSGGRGNPLFSALEVDAVVRFYVLEASFLSQ